MKERWWEQKYLKSKYFPGWANPPPTAYWRGHVKGLPASLSLSENFKIERLLDMIRCFQILLSTHTNFILAVNGESLKEQISESEISVALFIRPWTT